MIDRIDHGREQSGPSAGSIPDGKALPREDPYGRTISRGRQRLRKLMFIKHAAATKSLIINNQ
jgi:hypothetical protein